MSQVLKQLDDYIGLERLLSKDEKLLIAVSGGMDSMFLLSYLIQMNYNLEVAHCNFGLREEESDGDESFVQDFCQSNTIKFHSKRFETSEYALANGISIQMAARDLRYAWFDQLRETHFFDKLVTAHHKTDSTETILLNLTRGTGLKGLIGIPAISGFKVRPLIQLSRTEIAETVFELKIPYRDDSSNASDKYHRNRIRHHILPQFLTINQGFEQSVNHTASIVSQALGFINHFMQTIKNDCVEIDNQEISIDIKQLLKYPEPAFVLYEILKDYGFNSDQAKDILMVLQGISGKQFFSTTHRLTKASTNLIIQKHPDFKPIEYLVNFNDKSLKTENHSWQFEVSENTNFSKIANEAVIDFSKLTFPLVIRTWKSGDKVRPIGMQGHKKVSDILIDTKLSIPQKEKVWILISAQEIVWINELVLSNDFKVTSSTQKVLRVRTETP